ncbi:GNAT family N-acetyltransferase [Bradyrhizobium diazoefficiens]|nr:GNAT family N-acetyltransferase [Bradyrhizobium diazoefficiens]MBR0964684.1 GNAT family N-acetyltransferase [Bradyrhizobium diazoefficiens]MBR0978857.1 GNAT family N-acetyltransferase [Bradyrhizobium diazoefficiens]MBR1006671.1 GNAT family N-acetyltransferase [Bradyrhizobium diazoefficiens]MBR1014473.1 GNAT family N-acetyltransferase [Bradyrhizobium diazoefficiens]MBR1051852.1 GNAT family N-acetyltransferase [Bradyrhizobium diazoefficiens]
MISVRSYSAQDEAAWNGIVLQSRTGNFLHLRSYMDYHSDRFIDQSLIVLQDDQPCAVFPASLHGDTISSHGGLTYGGLLATTELRAQSTLEAFEKIAAHYASAGRDKMVYKAVPHVFHRYPSEEDLYALFRMGARLQRRDISSVVEIGKAPKYSKGRKWTINKARKANLVVAASDRLDEFHELLCRQANERGRQVVHSLSELQLLKSRFPDRIVLYEARAEGLLQAGALIYDFGSTVHTQYLASSDFGRAHGALDLVISELVTNQYGDRRYFSFGISTEQSGRVLNEGLVAQKEGFGGRGVVHDFYEMDLK